MGGGLRVPYLAEMIIAPKRMYVLIWNFLTFPKDKKQKKLGNV